MIEGEKLREETVAFWWDYCADKGVPYAEGRKGESIIREENDPTYWNTRSMATLWERAHVALGKTVH
jgi:hypothetical protein